MEDDQPVQPANCQDAVPSAAYLPSHSVPPVPSVTFSPSVCGVLCGVNETSVEHLLCTLRVQHLGLGVEHLILMWNTAPPRRGGGGPGVNVSTRTLHHYHYFPRQFFIFHDGR